MELVEINTKRLTLRPFGEADIDPMLEILNGKDVLRYFPKTDPISRERVGRMIERILQHWEDHGFGLWAVELITTGDLIGRCGLQVIQETGEQEVDFILGRKYWDRGFATEAGYASLEYGFDVRKMEAIVGIVHIENFASQKVLEKLGMIRTRRANYFGIDCYRYAITQSEFSLERKKI